MHFGRTNKVRAIGLALLLFCCAIVLAAGARADGQVTELRPYRAGGWLRAVVRAHDLLDDRTRSTVESGLPGTCIYGLRLEDRSGRLLAETFVERTLRYDLWENTYLLQQEDVTSPYSNLAAADSALSYLADCGICPLNRLEGSAEYRIVVRIAVRPLATEDRERLSRYVSRTTAGEGEEVSIDLGALFNHIIGEKGKSKRVVEHSGLYFRLAELEEVP